MTKYLYTLALVAFLLTSGASAQTVTRTLTLTLDVDKIDIIKLLIANRDNDPATVTEDDITNAVGLDWIQAQMDRLVRNLQAMALLNAIESGRTDIVPAGIVTGAGDLQTAQDAQDSLEVGGTGVQ